MRLCLHCNKLLVKNVSPKGVVEGVRRFAEREYCGRMCKSAAKIKAQGGYKASTTKKHFNAAKAIASVKARSGLFYKVATQAWSTGFSL